jgi:hypothetical protein
MRPGRALGPAPGRGSGNAERHAYCWWCDGLTPVLRRRFEPGTALTIILLDKARRGVHSFPVQVVHATLEGKSRWLIGCAFLSPLREEELQTLVGDKPAHITRPSWCTLSTPTGTRIGCRK